jgi:hypothetical protein
MKFVNYLETIAGVGIFPMISLGIFFTFFVILTIWVFKVNKERMLEMKNIPLDKTNEPEHI